jgi:hypothetical protein
MFQDGKHDQAGWIKTDQSGAGQRQAECVRFCLKNEIAEERKQIPELTSDTQHQLAIDHAE